MARQSIPVKSPLAHQRGPDIVPNRIVDSEDVYSHTAYPRPANQVWTIPFKMIAPSVLPRVKQLNDLSGCRISARDIRAFAPITTPTGKGKILHQCLPAMLDRQNVIDMHRARVDCWGQMAVFASPIRATPNAADQFLGSRTLNFSWRLGPYIPDGQTGLWMHDGQKVRDIEIAIELNLIFTGHGQDMASGDRQAACQWRDWLRSNSMAAVCRLGIEIGDLCLDYHFTAMKAALTIVST
jgi:hypothetical protein